MPDALCNKRVLIAEDHGRLAVLYAQFVKEFGAEVLGPVSSGQDVMDLLKRETPDVALLDVSLKDGPVFEIAGYLRVLGIPFVFATGYDADDVVPENLRDSPRLVKPFSEDQLRSELCRILSPASA